MLSQALPLGVEQKLCEGVPIRITVFPFGDPFAPPAEPVGMFALESIEGGSPASS